MELTQVQNVCFFIERFVNNLIFFKKEWKPTCFGGTNVEENLKVALLQISTSEKVYLLDMVKLSSSLDKNDCEIFAKKFLTNRKIIKIGYGFTQDLKMIARAFDDIRDTDIFRQTVLDLAYFANKVKFFLDDYGKIPYLVPAYDFFR